MSEESNSTSRKLAAIVFTDIVGFTALSSKNEPAAIALLKNQRDTLQPIVEKHGGDWLKEIGDGLLLSFNTVKSAVEDILLRAVEGGPLCCTANLITPGVFEIVAV